MSNDNHKNKPETGSAKIPVKRIFGCITKQYLADWESDEEFDPEVLHLYFEETYGRWYWPEIYTEGISVFKLMFDEEFDDYSPMGVVFAAVGAQAADGAFSAVAAAIGTTTQKLRCAVAPWYENQDELPPPIGCSGIQKEVSGVEHLLVCVKCKCTDIKVRWHKTGYTNIGKRGCGDHDVGKTTGEHLHYYCKECLFDWTGEVAKAT